METHLAVKWIRSVNWGKLLLGSAVYTGIAGIVHNGEAALMMPYYTDPGSAGVWSRLMMPKAGGPPPSSFFIMSVIVTFITGVSVGLIYYYLRDMLPKAYVRRSLMFADVMIASSFIFFTFPVFLMFNVPMPLLGSWFISEFIILTSASFLYGKLLK